MKSHTVEVDRMVCYVIVVDVPDDASLADIHAAGEAAIAEVVENSCDLRYVDGLDFIKAQRSIPCRVTSA